ncbi:MAG: Crp/Fnr family transcriptional regulator [Rhodocyclaceae bacterium]|nr:Crp/Fnr family transcriptional regulator [Rhodocyclaceae bacterium]
MLFFDLFRNDPKMIKVDAGQELFHEGDAGDVMYVLITGEATVRIGKLVLENVGPGAILGEMAVVDGSPRSTTVSANTVCTFTIIDQKRFQFLVDESPRFAIEVMKVMAQRLRQCDQNLARATTDPK